MVYKSYDQFRIVNIQIMRRYFFIFKTIYSTYQGFGAVYSLKILIVSNIILKINYCNYFIKNTI